jgi:hypothetical protein
MWVSFTITASKAQNLPLIPWFPVCSAFPVVALRRAEKTKFEKYSKGVMSRSDIRFIPFVLAEFGTLGVHATAFLTEKAKQATTSKGMDVGM